MCLNSIKYVFKQYKNIRPDNIKSLPRRREVDCECKTEGVEVFKLFLFIKTNTKSIRCKTKKAGDLPAFNYLFIFYNQGLLQLPLVFALF